MPSFEPFCKHARSTMEPKLKSTTTTHRRRKLAPIPPSLEPRAIIARRLDLMAGVELQHGHHLAAERLARRAAEMREAS